MPPDKVFCKACGDPLGNPEKVLHDPEGKSPVGQDLGGSVDNPDDHHIAVVDGPGGDGFRYQCAVSGKMTSLVSGDPNQTEEESPTKNQDQPSGGGSGGDPKPQPQNEPQPPRRGSPGGDIYEISPEQNAMDILEDVITNEAYGLSGGQINEVKDWGDIYDGQIPPDKLEAVLQNLSGVAKQKASLMREKYEAKISKWVRQQSEQNSGPRIGAHTGRMGPQAMGGGGGQNQQPPQPQPSPSPQPSPEPEPEPSTPARERKSKRERRVERRQEALDKAVDRAAEEMAQNFAADFGTFFTDAREIFTTVLRKKAESDPEWFFEKMEKWDMDLFDEVMSASESKKTEQKSRMSQADAEIDDALSALGNDTQSEPHEPEQDPRTDPEPPENLMGQVEDHVEEEMDEEIEDEEINGLLEEMEAQ